MPTDRAMPIQARRVFRLALTTAVALALAHALGLVFAYLSPIFALLLALRPAPPMGPRALLAFVLLVLGTTVVGLLLVPALMHYPLTAVLLVALGVYFSFYLTVHLRQQLLGSFVALGFTLISAAGHYNFALGQQLVESLVGGIVTAVISLWLVYPWFPEDHALAAQAEAPLPPPDPVTSKWIALRGTLIVLPVYLLALNNPSLYLAAVMKSVSLGQQASDVDAASAGRELVGSTFVAGCLAVLFWVALSILPNLWMYFLWLLLLCLYAGSRIYGLRPSRFSPSFWLNTLITLLILLGPATADLQGGKDVYMAFLVRMGLFFFITLYAWGTLTLLDNWRRRRAARLATCRSG